MVWYQRGKLIQMDPNAIGVGEPPFALLLDIIRIALMRATYTLDVDNHEQFDDIVAQEIVATNYAPRGDGIELAGKGIARDDPNGRVEFDPTVDLQYVGIGNGQNDTFDQIVVMREQDAGASDANTELIAHANVAATTTNGGNVTLVFNPEGLLQLT